MKNKTAFWIGGILILAAFLLVLVVPESVLAENLGLTNKMLRITGGILGAIGLGIFIYQMRKN